MAQEYGPKVVTDGLVLCLDAADKNSYPGSGTTWSDLSGNNLTGTITNATFSTDKGGCIDFDGSGDYVNFGDVINQAYSFSISCWINADNPTSPGWQSFCTKGMWDTWRFGFGSTTGKIHLAVAGADGWDEYYQSYFSPTVLSSNTWYYVAAVYNHTEDKIYHYINGQLDGSYDTLAGPNLTNDHGLYVGGSISGYMFNGKIATSRVYDRALSAKEISQNFNAQRSRFSV